MTGDETPDPADERVRELLGDLGPAGPIPPEVSDRIGAALAGLPTPTDAPDAAGPGRRVGRWLAAAAAVVVVAGGATMLVQQAHDGGAAGSADSAAADSARSSVRAPGAKDRSQRKGAATQRLDSLATGGRIALPKVRSDHFAHDVRALVAVRNEPSGTVPGAKGGGANLDAKGPGPGCTPPPGTRRRDVLTIAYDGRLAQLVVTGSGGDRVAKAYTCSGTKLLDSAPIG